MRVLVVDDEALARALLRSLLEELPDLEIVAEASEGAQAVASAREARAELVFLDIDMPGLNGVLAAAEIVRGGAELIFVTAHEQHALDAFELGAADYLLKPVRRLRLATAVERARQRLAARAPLPERTAQDEIWAPIAHGSARLVLADLIRVEAAGDHLYLHTAERAYLYRATMTGLAPRLTAAGLIRVHRSCFVRPDQVVKIIRRGKRLILCLEGGSQTPVGATYRSAVLSAFAPD